MRVMTLLREGKDAGHTRACVGFGATEAAIAEKDICVQVVRDVELALGSNMKHRKHSKFLKLFLRKGQPLTSLEVSGMLYLLLICVCSTPQASASL